MRNTTLPTILFAALVALTWGAGTTHAETAEYDAIASARHDLKLGFTVGGKIESVPVKAGERVTKGTPLIHLEAEEKQSLVDVYKIRASSTLESQAAEAKLKLARLEEARLRELIENDAAAKFELERAIISAVVAKLEHELAERTRLEVTEQLRQAEAQLALNTLLAPTEGIVDEIAVSDGELVDAGKPVLRLVVTDPLWIDVAVPTARTMTLKKGDAAWVKSKLPGQDKVVQGKVLYLREVADSAADRRLVRVEVPNPDNLPAGIWVKVSFDPPAQVSATTSPAATEAQP